jgi:predicted ABC-class ATPase
LRNRDDLKRILSGIKGRGFKAYRELKGVYAFEDFVLLIDHVQSDPFAAPSRFRVQIPKNTAGFPEDTYKNKSRETGLRDFLTRQFYQNAKKISRGSRGTGKSGLITIDSPGQEVLERTSVLINNESVEARFYVGLPASGRTVLSQDAEEMILDEIPRIIQKSMFYRNLEAKRLYRHIETSEDADFLRDHLPSLGLISFVSDSAVLPRASGIDSRPLSKGQVIRFQSPESFRVSTGLPNRAITSGMGIREGITLIVGGGYHGKSTLLDAVKLGVYNHVPGDGREFVVTVKDAVMIRAEDGRRIEGVDISPFISNLPFGEETESFRSEDASGSTSQAANIIEAMEVGVRAILIDEDTSATNFMIRDHRMQELISKDMEPITPFIDRIQQLYKDHSVSSILVIGGSGDYFDVADYVISMNEYLPRDCTSEAKTISEKYRTQRIHEGGEAFGLFRKRIPMSDSFDPRRGNRDVRISSRGLLSIIYGTHHIDLGAVAQLVDISQTRAIGDAIHYATRFMNGKRTLKEIIDLVLSDIDKSGLDVLSGVPYGDYAAFRAYEFASAINRLRTLRVTTGDRGEGDVFRII